MADPIDTRPAEAALLRELDGLRQDLRDHREETRTEIVQTRHLIDEKLDDIVTEARRTNGRLRRAELWIAGLKALAATATLLIPFAVVIFSKNL